MKTIMKMKFAALFYRLGIRSRPIVACRAKAEAGRLMNRLGPSQMTLYIANADGSGEHPLFPSSGFDYNASFSPDGKWIMCLRPSATAPGKLIFIACVWMAPDSSAFTDDPALDDQARISPDGNQLAFVSTRGAAHRQYLGSGS